MENISNLFRISSYEKHMKIIDENGRYHTINLSKYYSVTRENCSDLHAKVREFLIERFQNAQILEEVHVPSWNIYLDFYIPLYKLAVEADGAQHAEYVPFFHKNKLNFAAAKGRDNKKKNFCETNHIILVRFAENESEEEWRTKLIQSMKK